MGFIETEAPVAAESGRHIRTVIDVTRFRHVGHEVQVRAVNVMSMLSNQSQSLVVRADCRDANCKRIAADPTLAVQARRHRSGQAKGEEQKVVAIPSRFGPWLDKEDRRSLWFSTIRYTSVSSSP